MKKGIFLIFSILFLAFLSGCDASRESDMEYMVSAIGFEEEGETLTVFAEIIAVNAQEKNENVKRIVVNGEGKNIKDAVKTLHKSLTKPLFLNHCAVLLVSDNLSKERLLEITDFALDNPDITKSIEVFAVSDIEALLDLETTSAIAIGYELPTTLKQWEKYIKKEYPNSFYKIKAKIKEKREDVSVPYITVEEKGYSINEKERIIFYKPKLKGSDV